MSWQNGSSLSGKREVSDTLTNASPEAEGKDDFLAAWFDQPLVALSFFFFFSLSFVFSL